MFDHDKLIFHLNRCKDRLKVGHLYRTCSYNKIHIVLKEDLETHELICDDREEIRRLTTRLRNTMNSIERERSREKYKKEEIKVKEEKEREEEEEENDNEKEFENCSFCQDTLIFVEKIKNENLKPETLNKIDTLKNLIKKYDKVKKK